MSTLKLFNKAIPGKEVDYNELCGLGYQVGYLVDPDCCTIEVKQFLLEQSIDYSSTFYQSWTDVISKNRLELFIDQILHYLTTYGNLTNEGDVYLPPRTANIPDCSQFKIIQPISKEEAITQCKKTLSSGIALTQETINLIFNVFNKLDYKINIDSIKNKEAKMLVCKTSELLPNDPVEFVRYLIYLATEKTLLIKNTETLNRIKLSNLDINGLIKQFGLEKISSIFHRFKPIFLAFKQAHSNNRSIINKLRKLANKHHKPYQPTYFENILSDHSKFFDFSNKVETLNNFKKITLLEAIKAKLTSKITINAYVIRNGKLWIEGLDSYKDKKKIEESEKNIYEKMYSILYQSLINSLKAKVETQQLETVKLPKNISIPLPKSEKSFVGNYPLGTLFELTNDHAIVGINWKEIDGARDLDLSLIDIDGDKFGWDSDYYNEDKSIIYSGDMTSADPEATELFYAAKGFKPSLVKVNRYFGEVNAKFTFFIANEKVSKLDTNYMVNPNNITFKVNELKMDSRAKTLGVITDDKFILAQVRTGKKRVAGASITNNYLKYLLDTINHRIYIHDIAEEIGLKVVDDNYQGKIDVDLTNIPKNTLIELLS